jgi:phenylpropionate dioxygenase-like ring-hydroxylating dioxygenase large terminal subunit
MLTETKSRLLCDVSPGTPMGKAFRRFWLPVMRSERLEAGGFAVKFTVLCEDFVAFKARNGEVAVFDEKCPHRGCSLELAHARDDSLVCFFHGWKFHVSGKCVETPNEVDPAFPARVPLKSHPAREAGGVLWVYFGDDPPPPFPDLIFTTLPEDQVYPRMAICDFNWLTGLEAVLDPSHVTLLHRDWVGAVPNQDAKPSPDIITMSANAAPVIDFEETDYGFRYCANRTMPDGQTYVRVSEYVAPCGVFIATTEADRKFMIASVPIDNHRSIQWYFWYSPDRPMPAHVRAFARGGTDADDDNFYHSLKGLPFYGQDRRAIRAGKSTTGFYDIMFEDFVAGESQGAWPDRSKEFLGGADMAIMRARRYLLAHLPESGEPTLGHRPGVNYKALQALAVTVPGDADWKALADEATAARAARLVESS